MLALTCLLGQATVGLTGAQTAPAAQPTAPAAAAPRQSTPELLDAAVAAGQITREQRLL